MNFPLSSHTWLKLRTKTWQPKSLSKLYAVSSCALLSASPGSRTTDLCHQLTTYGSSEFAGTTTNENPWETTFETLLCTLPPEVNDHLWVVSWWEIFLILEKKKRRWQYWTLSEPCSPGRQRQLRNSFTILCLGGKYQQGRTLVSYYEIKPSVPFPRSPLRLMDSLPASLPAQAPFLSFETFLFDKYSPYAIARNKIISLIVLFILSFKTTTRTRTKQFTWDITNEASSPHWKF